MVPLPDELLEEIFLRLPPDEPEWLLRASLASKLWLGRLTDPRFHARYADFHGAAPMLGFFQSGPYSEEADPFFVSTTKAQLCIPDPGYMGEAWDCRHGRVLIEPRDVSPKKLVVLDPIAGSWTELFTTPGQHICDRATVLCAAVNGCDHRACQHGPSRVVVVGLHMSPPFFVAYAYDYLLETSTPRPRLGRWDSELSLGSHACIQPAPPVLVQDALYFMLVHEYDYHVEILTYDLCSKSLSLIDPPIANTGIDQFTILMGMEDGTLGFAYLHQDGLTLKLWSRRQMGCGGVWSWTQYCRVIDLKELLPISHNKSLGRELMIRPIGSVEGGDIIFVTTQLGIYKINLKSLECKKIWNKGSCRYLIPFTGFYYPQERAN